MKIQLKNQIPSFLSQGPITGKGLPLGNYLAWILAGFYLLPLDFKIPRPFLRVQDDYLVFCKKRDEPQKILKEIIIPELERLKLNISIKKLKSGKFHQDKVNFLGFNFYAGYFAIHPNKKEEFRKRIIKITYLTNKKKEKTVIKLLNNKILGFGHYYKQSACKRDFEELDAFIRMRLRRWFLKQKEFLPKQSNLVLSNKVLKKMGLKSLLEIKNKFELKKSSKKKKNRQKRSKKW